MAKERKASVAEYVDAMRRVRKEAKHVKVYNLEGSEVSFIIKEHLSLEERASMVRDIAGMIFITDANGVERYCPYLKTFSLFYNKVYDYIRTVEGAASRDTKARRELEELARYASGANGKDVNVLLEKLAKVREYIDRNSLATETWNQKMQKTFGGKIRTLLAGAVSAKIAQYLRTIYINVRDLNTELTQLRIVTDANQKSLDKFTKTATSAAKRIGASVTDLTKSATVFARLGYSLEESEKFAELTAAYSKVADTDVSSASSAITSIVKAFGVNSNELEGLLDKLMWVGQTFPISADEIGEGMKEAGSALQASGNTLVQSIALLTAANTTVQDVNKAATAMRTITARMQSSTTDLENLGESIDDLVSTADLDRYMRAFGIAVTDATGELRATYDVLNDLSKIWNDLSTTDKASIAEKLSGNRQQNIFLSLMNSFDSARQVVSDIDKSTGLLADATEMRVDSIQGKVNQLKATLEEMSQKLLNSTLVKTAVTVAGGLVTVLEKITDLLGGIPGLAFIAFSAFGGSARNSAMNGLKDFMQTLEVIFGKKYVLDIPFGKEFNESVEKERNLFNAMVDDFQSEGGTLASAIDKNLKDAGKAVKEYVKMNEDAILATKGNAEETKKLFDKHIKETLATDAFAESVKTFKGSVNAIRLYNNGIDGAGIEQDQFNRAVAEGNPQLKAYLDSVEQGKASVWGYTKAAYSAQIATLALTAGVTAAQLGLRFIKWYTDDSTEALRNFASAALALGAVITLTILAIKKQWAVFKGSNLIGWIVLAIELVVNGIIQIGKGIKNIVNSTTNAKNTAVEAAQAARDALGEVQDKLEKVNDKLKTAKDRYEELQKKAKSGSLTLSERNELKELDRRIALLEAEAAAANAEERVKNKTSQVAAADAIRKTLDESVSSAKLNEKDRWWRWLYSFVANDKEILRESANKKNASKWVDDILENWENATDKEKEFISNYKKALDEQKDSLTYYSGSNLEQWQEDINAAYDDYWRFIQKFLIADGQFEQAWNSIVSMERFDGIDRLFQSIAGDDLSESALRTLYTTNAQFKDFVNYLESVGIFAWDDATKVGTLANSICSFAKQVSAVESKSPLAILEAIEDRYDRLFKAMSDMREYGALTADTLSEILQDTELAKYLSQTANGFELSSDAMERWIETLIAAYSAESALSNLKEDNKTTILSNLKNLRAVLATLTVISKEDSYEKEKDDLNDRLDKFKELIDMRKKLLETYQEELDYQKELAKKQESVASLQTKLAIAQLDDSAAGRARVRELEQKLKEAQEELDDYTLEHAIQEIESELDEQYGEYEKFIKDKLDAIEAAINGVGSGFELDQGMFQNMLSKIDALITEISEKPTPDNSGYVMDYADWAEYWHKQHPDIAGPAPPRPTSAEFKAAQDYVTSRGMREGDKARWGQDKNFLELLRAYEATGGSIKDIIGVYHSGGLVGDVSTLESSEEYAKLLKGEFVSTPAMMSRFMKQTLPAMLSFGTRGAEFNAPLVEIQCDNVTTEALPGLRKIVDDAVSEIKRQFDSGFSRTGYRKSVRQI